MAANVKKTSARGEAISAAEFALGTLLLEVEELALVVLDELEPEPVGSLLAIILGRDGTGTDLSCLRCLRR